MLGAIAGDIIGSRYEFSGIKHADFDLFPEHFSYTDDTVLTCAVADSLLNDRDIADCLREWPREVKIDATKVSGYGQRFMRWAASPAPQPSYGSYGNGGAMRVSPCAWLAKSLPEVRSSAKVVTEVTHDHPEGIKGAFATADAIWFFRQGSESEFVRKRIALDHGYDMDRTIEEIRKTHIRNETATGTVPESIICALDAISFEDAIRNAVSLGGDTDTMAAIAGSIAEARFGVPDWIEERVLGILDSKILTLLDQFKKAIT